jgi:uncharacterized protein YmfQ (DUF2313 family)
LRLNIEWIIEILNQLGYSQTIAESDKIENEIDKITEKLKIKK